MATTSSSEPRRRVDVALSGDTTGAVGTVFPRILDSVLEVKLTGDFGGPAWCRPTFGGPAWRRPALRCSVFDAELA